MTWLNRSNKSPIGIDIGSKYIRAVQLQRIDGAWHIEAATTIPRSGSDFPVGQKEVYRFASLLDRQGFVGRDVVLAVPENALLGGILKLPPRDSGAPLDQIAKMEMARMHRCDPESFEMASWDLPAAGPKANATQVMVAACPHEDSDCLLATFEAASLNVIALDTGAWSIARACSPLFAPAPSVTGILDLGWDLARLIVLYDGVIIYERTIPEAGIQSLSDALIKRRGMNAQMIDLLLLDTVSGLASGQAKINPEHAQTLQIALSIHVDSVAEELKQSFSYALHKYPGTEDQQLLLVGGGAGVTDMPKHMADATGLKVQSANISDLVHCPNDLTQSCHSPALIKALGLAMHGEVPKP